MLGGPRSHHAPAMHATLGGAPLFTVFTGLAAGHEDLRLQLPSSGGVRVRVRGAALASLTLARFLPDDAMQLARQVAATVQVLDRQIRSLSTLDGGAPGSWVTCTLESGGARELELVLGEPGWYRISAASPPLLTVASDLLWFDAGEHELEVRPPATTGALRGRLMADGTRDFYGLVLTDEDGRILATDSRVDGSGRASVLPVKASGDFVLPALPTGRYRVRAGSVSELEQGRFAREIELELAAGENPPLEIEL